jgi:hypothetical protein
MNRPGFAVQGFLWGTFASAPDHGSLSTAGCLAMAMVIVIFAGREDREDRNDRTPFVRCW